MPKKNSNKVNGIKGFSERFVLQDTDELKEAQLRELKTRERGWVKEGQCEECGGFGILSRYKEVFLCSECLKLINSNNKKSKKVKAKTRRKRRN